MNGERQGGIALLGNGVKAPRMEGMAFEDSLDGKPESSNGSVFLNRFHGVVRACRVEPAAIEQQGRQHALIHTDREYQQFTKHASILASNTSFDN